MKKYCIAITLALVLLFIGTNTAFADELNPFTQTKEEQNKSLANWKKALVGEDIFQNGSTDPDLEKILQTKKNDLKAKLNHWIEPKPVADEKYPNITKKENMNPLLFDDIKDETKDSNDNTILAPSVSAKNWQNLAVRIEEMATLYMTPDPSEGSYYKNTQLRDQIIYALNWYSTMVFTPENGEALGVDVWYEKQISSPLSIVNTLTLMKDDIDNKLLQKYLTAIDGLEPPIVYNYASTDERYPKGRTAGSGANRVNKGFVLLMRGILDSENANNKGNEQADLGIKIMKYAFLVDAKGEGKKNTDGFYPDGSFIQHSYIPYTTGYGSDILARSANMFQLFDGTSGLDHFNGYENLFTILDKTYQPVLYKNETLDMTRGRQIAQSSHTSENKANEMLYDMYNVSQENTDLKYKSDYEKLVKSSIVTASSKPNFYKNLSIPQAQAFKTLLNNENISSEYPEAPKNIMMSRASQMIDQKKGYVAGLSMFSKNVSSFESINGANVLGMYTGTGALSIYNGDDAFKNNYYPTVGMTSLPGTTTDLSIRKVLKTDPTPIYANTESWTGGVSDGTYGSATMDYTMKDVTESNLAAKKSWFFLDGKIVAMGNDITNDNNLNTQTIVENRQLQDSSTNFSVNGQNIALSGPTKTVENVKWAYLDNVTESQRIGYIFPDAATSVNAYKTEQTGHWSDLSSAYEPGKGTPEVKATYAGLTIPHKVNPTDAFYTYVILPGASKKDTELKANKIGAGMNNDIVTFNTDTIQGVLDKENTLAITNYRTAGESEYADMTTHNYNSTAFTPGSILIRYATTEEKTITLADPSKNEEKIRFSIPKESYTVIGPKSENITATSNENDWDITVDTSSKTGESFKVTFKKSPPKLTSIAPYTIGLDNYIQGTFSGDIAKISIMLNDVEKQTINVTGSDFKYYANNLIKSLNDEVFVIGYDSSGTELGRKKVDIGAKGTMGLNVFKFSLDSYVTGTYSGDILKVMLKVNGIDKQTISVQDGIIKYYAKAMITQKDDVVELLGYNSAGILVSTATLPVSVPTGSITMNNYTLGNDSYVTGTFTGDVAKLSLTINNSKKTTINIPDNPFQYYAKSLITKASDVVIATAYDMNGNVLAESTIRVVNTPKITMTDVNTTGYIKGKVEGDITTVKLSINGLIQASKSLVQEDATFQYYIKSLNLKASDTVELIGLNADGKELTKTIVQIP